MGEGYLESVANKAETKETKIKKLRVIIEMPKDFDFKKEVEKAMKQKLNCI